MAEGPADVVSRFLDALSEEDIESAIAYLDADAYFVASGSEVAPSQGDFSGHEGFRRWWEQGGTSPKKVVPLRVEELDSRHAFAEAHMGTIHGPKTWVSVGVGVVATVREGRIEALELFNDPEEVQARLRIGAR